MYYSLTGDLLYVVAGNGSDQWTDATVDEFMTKFLVSAVGSYLTTKPFYPQLKKSSSPLVVNILSNAGCISGRFFLSRFSLFMNQDPLSRIYM